MDIVDIYNYEPFYGFYLSVEKYKLQFGLGLPAHSTRIKPPLFICAEGYIPVFQNNKWVIEKDNFWKPIYKEINYKSGFPVGTYKPIQISLFLGDFPKYPDLPQVCNSNLVCMLIGQKVRAAQGKYQEAVDLYNSFDMSGSFAQIPVDGPRDLMLKFLEKPTEIYQYHFLVEEMVTYMSKILV